MEPLHCPLCESDKTLSGYDRVDRKLRMQDGTIQKLRIRRLLCPHCHRTHRELPDRIIPYKRYERESIEEVLNGNPKGAPDDERTREKLRSWYKQIRNYLKGILTRQKVKWFASPEKKISLQSMVKVVVNAGLWTTHPNGRWKRPAYEVSSS